MLKDILIQVKKLTKILTWPRTVGPLLTVIFTIVYHLGSLYFGYTIAIMPLAVFMALGSFTGVRAGVICALWISAYAWLTIPDTSRVIQIGLGALAIAGAVGLQARALRASLAEIEAALAREREAWLKAEEGERAIQALNALNGNILRVKEARDKLLNVLNTQSLVEPARKELREALHTLNNLELATRGWQELAELKDRIARQDNDPAN